ncbi:uncharacterized protein LOC108625352 isoform X2 [Ceratina calcarata]|uniref:Uncharacterized protein LOC108625352 isoform X2 n=1 Tax=Ceratina calcarata TaxID=156304 RepID=A0AAJ7J037_9HYME|nr:uncharacterized protein LOC108625352 isoform X2 [Ceratina calcarata]
MCERRLSLDTLHVSLGINVSILVILTIFGVLLSLPLRLLLNTNYHSRNETLGENRTSTENTTVDATVIPADHKKLKRCPMFEYEDRLKSAFRCDYDGNCTYAPIYLIDPPEENRVDETNDTSNETSEISKEIGENLTENAEDGSKDRQSKSVPVAGHILVTMLVISAIAALVEVLRIRFAKDKAGSAGSRKASTIELPLQRRFLPRYPMNGQRSFEMHRSALRLLGARPPPLIRRSSFPTQQSNQISGSVAGTPISWVSRRRSAESDEELINALHHRTRLIRRH